MENILIAEDDLALQKTLFTSLQTYKNKLNVIFADNGEEAIKLLNQIDFSLLVTDIKMPKVDGLALLAYVSKNFTWLPCIVITAHEIPNVNNKFEHNIIKFCSKPIQVDKFVQTIIQSLRNSAPTASFTGISVAGFLQLVEMERKTCLIQIHSPGSPTGLFYFRKGIPCDAIYGNLRGEEAAYKMIIMDSAQVTFKKLPKKKIKMSIKTSLMKMLFEAMKSKDESSVKKRQDDLIIKKNVSQERDYNRSATAKVVSVEHNKVSSVNAEKKLTLNNKEVFKMALETYLNELRSIKGYKAAAVMNFTGEVLAADSVDPNVELETVGAVFNDIFRSSHEASGKVGLSACNEMAIKTPNGIIAMACSGVDAAVHFHLIGILSGDGNQALMKLQFDKMIPAIMHELA